MRKLNYILGLLLLSASSMVFTSCSNDDSDKGIDNIDPATRLKLAEKELKEKLVSAEDGWIVDFFPSNKIMGGYRMWYLFQEDGIAQVRSDIDFDNTVIKNDEYNFVLLGSLALNFKVGGVVHEFIKMNEASNHTDIEFIIDSYEDDMIIFKGHTTRNKIVFRKATAEDRKFDLSKNKQMMEAFDGPQSTMFKSLVVDNQGSSTIYSLDYSGSSRRGRVVDAEKIPINSIGGLGFGFTPTGVVVNPAIIIGGEEVTNLDYNAATKEFVGHTSTGKVTVKNLDAPVFMSDDYKDLISGKTVGFIFEDLWGAPSNSLGFSDAVVAYYNALPPTKKGMLDRIQIGFNGNNSSIRYTFKDGLDPYIHNVRLTTSANGRLVFTSVSKTGTLPAQLQSIDDALVHPAGFFVKKEDSFGRYTNKVYSLSSASPIKIAFATYLF